MSVTRSSGENQPECVALSIFLPCLCPNRAARFKGFQQQDSQELLRYLLDAMRAEETKVRV